MSGESPKQMKTFSELISWELEQDKKQTRSLAITTEEASGKIGASMLRKMRYLSAAPTMVRVPEAWKPA